MKKETEVSYGVIPLRNNSDTWQIFLIRNINGNHWGFPKGKPQENESHRDAALRELKEETGLLPVKFLSEDPLVESYHVYRSHSEIQKKVYYYLVQVEGNVKLQEEEISDGKWFFFKEAYSKITFDESKFIFSKVQELMRNIHS